MKIAESLSFPRAVGSAGEEAAASLIEKRLLGLGYVPRREEFCIPLTPWAVMKGFIFLASLILLGARLLAASFPIFCSLPMFLIVTFLAFYTPFWLKLIDSAGLSRWLAGRKKKSHLLCSQNILATLPALGKAENHLYLVAHYDSKSQSLSLPLRALALLLSGLTCLWLGLIYLGSSEQTLGFFPSWPVDIPVFLALLGMVPLLFLKTTNQSPGGLDNAGSLGTLLHLAEILKRRRPCRCEVTFLFSSAEELGLQGAFAYLQKHREEIKKEKSYFLNLDSVGVRGKTRILYRKGSLLLGKESSFASRLEEIGKPFNIGTLSFSFGIMMDHQAFLEKGYQAASLACASSKIRNVHTARDTADHLEEEGLEEVGKFILAVIQSCEKASQ